MLTLQSMMLVALGILIASLLIVAILPAYRSRIRRLTTDEIRRSVPLTEAEIRADKDKLRAQYAIRVHKLEAEAEQMKLAAARQRIEMNRRDARVTELQDEADRIKAALEENINARRVLEHTVTDRLPRLEQQLESARFLIQERDQEMVSLKGETTRSVRALDEAMQLNAQQRGDIERLKSSMGGRATGPRDPAADSRFEGELALRSEIEALRARTREQAAHILRLQSGDGQSDPPDVEQLRRELAEAEAALRSAREAVESGSFDRAAAEAQVKALEARIDEQAAEMTRLSTAVAVYEGAGEGSAGEGRAVPGGRLQSKARLNALQAQITQQSETIQRLRAELAASNERLARQAAHYMEEMRRLGAGTVPTSFEPRRGQGPRRSLVDRISPTAGRGTAAAGNGESSADAGAGRVSEYIRALGDDPPNGGDAASSADVQIRSGAEPAGQPLDSPPAEPAPRKRRLLERISSAGKG